MEHLPTAMGSLFMDSGAYGMYAEHLRGIPGLDSQNLSLVMKEKAYAFYTTKEFYTYCDAYAKFLKKAGQAVDFYVNVDAVFNPERSWEILKYLENEHGLSPLPVLHFNTPLKWFDKHLEAGYKYIGMGGLGQNTSTDDYIVWADRVYSHLSPAPTHLPKVKTHGFAMTSWTLMKRYPWWSVDSATWIKLAAYGRIYIPHRRGGKFDFTETPYILMVSNDTNFAEYSDVHLKKRSAGEQAIIREWLEEIGVPWGEPPVGDKPATYGITTHWAARAKANLLLFERFAHSMPKWPWPFLRRPQRGLL